MGQPISIRSLQGPVPVDTTKLHSSDERGHIYSL